MLPAAVFWNGKPQRKSPLYSLPFGYDTLALTLFMALVLGTDYHNFAVSLYYFALIAHGFYRRSYFHFFISLIVLV